VLCCSGSQKPNCCVPLKIPIVELSEAKQQFGCWLPEQRTIRISCHLITTYSWDVVLMVLKHEMAHQVCSEHFFLNNAGHGKAFQEACKLLGVPSPYNQSSGDLPDLLNQPSRDQRTTAGRKIIQRVNKLLALAESDNEHEAALAMQRATELLNRHNLETASEHNPSICVHLLINTGKKRIPSWRRTICGILQDYFFVEIVFSSLYDAQRHNSYKTIELLGRSENVPIAAHCYYFLEQQLESLWEKNRHKFTGNTKTAKNSYYLGLLHGFSEKLANQNKKTQRSCKGTATHPPIGALVISKDNALQDFVGFHFPRLRSHSAKRVRIYNQPYNEALDTGKNIVLHRSVTDTKKGVQGTLSRS
ncbi:MAG: DUF2786 domain-containing protein, partial [Candidatus Electrothrix sp. AR4]|nr:DUF2786 domain-containing protein [Candidatus Electrothrix sp. AR4]